MNVRLTEIYRYPIKSLSGLPINSSKVENYGLENDRCIMLVDENGLFISQRKHPQLALIKVQSESNEITLASINQTTITIGKDSFSNSKMKVEIWGDSCDVFVAKEELNLWFSKLLQQKVYLVKYDLNKPRATDLDYSRPTDIVSFADGFPILMISQSSLDDLNSKLKEPVSMLNFRPNLVVDGCDAFVEDRWKTIKIGSVEFDLVKQCSRCVLTTIDPKTGVKSVKGQPLKMLSSYRRNKTGVVFGMNLIPRNNGSVYLEDAIEVII